MSTASESQDSDMRLVISPVRAKTLAENLTSIQSRISTVTSKHQISKPIRLVAVSKLKPATDVLALHSQPTSHLHFGENYVQELLEKSRLLPKTVRWHFIGGLQSNKCLQLARDVAGLWAVESVDSVKKAGLLNKGRGERKGGEVNGAGDGGEEGHGNEPLRVFVQVNTSGEESKSGVEPKSAELEKLCKFVRDECKNLKLLGLMTIGAIARSQATTAETENEDFVNLKESRDWVVDKLGLGRDELELSMGMSEDFEGAIAMGSDEVRIGSTIFGERPPKKDAKVVEEVEDKKT